MAPYVENRSVAVRAARREQVMIVRLAVRLAVALEKVLGAELVAAVEADKVLRVPRPAEGRHHLSIDKNLAVNTSENSTRALVGVP